MDANQGALVRVDEVSVRFGGIVAVDSASIAVPSGEIRGLIGPNGAGKTTLFDTITGMRKPTAGRILFQGEDITDRPASWRSRHGMRRTFQRQQPFGWLSVEDNVLTAMDYHRGGGGVLADLVGAPGRRRRERERRESAREAIERCGLSSLSNESAGRLPIGKVRLLELARAIVDQPTLLLLDEPTSGLDEAEAGRFAEIVHGVREESDCAVLVVEHDMPFVMALSDRVTVLDLGRVIAEGTPAEISANELVHSAYFG